MKYKLNNWLILLCRDEHEIYPTETIKMPTLVGFLIFISGINLFLSWDEHEKGIITSGYS